MAYGDKPGDLSKEPTDDPREAFNNLVAPPTAEPTFDFPGGNTPAPMQSNSSSISLGAPQIIPLSAPIKRGKIDEAQKKLLGTTADERGRIEALKQQQQQQSDKDIGTAKTDINTYEQQANEQLKPLAAEMDRLRAQHEELSAAREANRARTQEAIQAMDGMSKRIAAEQPHDVWAEAGLGTKIATIALMGIGAAAQSFYGDKTNPVVDQIDASIKRDLTMQRMRIEKNKDDYANQNLLVNQMAQHFDRMEHAYDAAYSTAWNGVIGRMEIAKGMLAAPQMRANLDKVIAEANMKKAMAEQRLETGIGGQDARAKNAIMETEKSIAETEAKQGAVNANASAHAQTESRKAASMQIPGWQFPQGFQAGDQTVVNKLAEGEVTAKKVFNAMQRINDELKKVKSPADLLSTNAYREYKQAEAQLLEAARGPGFGNTGARFTDMMKKLEEQAFTPGTLGRMTPEESQKIVKRAQIALLKNLRDAFAEHGGVPSKHEFLGGE